MPNDILLCPSLEDEKRLPRKNPKPTRRADILRYLEVYLNIERKLAVLSESYTVAYDHIKLC